MPRIAAHVVLLGVVIAPAISCAGSDGLDTASFSVRDSAGVTITENTSPPIPRFRWTTSAVPLRSIGTVDGPPELQLYDVAGATRLPGGEIVVGNRGSYELRLYDSEDRHLRTIGREGGGPGEFLTLESVRLGPDGELLVWDSGALRLNVFSPGGELLRSQQLRADAFRFFPELVGVLADGSLLLTGGESNVFVVSARPARPPLSLWRYSHADETVDSVLTARGEERFTWGGTGFASRGPAPFGRKTFIAVHGNEIWVADNDRFEVRVHDAGGRLRRIIRDTGAALPVTAWDREEVRRRFLENSDPRFRPAMERMAAELPFPATQPAFGGLVVDGEGRTWLREEQRDHMNQWRVFGPDGVRLGRAKLPDGLEVLEIGRDHVLGVWRDEFEVEYVRLYRLETEEATER